jgi:subtilisin family serine protease
MSSLVKRFFVISLLLCIVIAPTAAQSAPEATHIVVFRDGGMSSRSPLAVESFARSYGLTVVASYGHALNGVAVNMPAGRAARLRADARVRYVEPVYYASTTQQTIPTGVTRINATSNPALRINGVDDFRVNVDVAVLDTGVDLTHPDLNVYAAVRCSRGRCTTRSANDGNGHGTHVAGTIGALDNGIGPVGVAPGARIWSVGVLGSNGSGSTADIIAGIDWVTANAGSIEVANMSLGGEFTSQALNDAITRSVNAGVVYVVAAGNSAKNAATFSPANHPDVITVSALADFNGLAGGGAPATCRSDVDDTLADFSNYGSVVEIAAPGVCIYSTWKSGGYNTISGTSMASPHVAGAAALIASVSNPNSRTDVMNIRAKLMADGNYNWVDDSPDGIKEPLLDVTGYDAR